MGLFARAASLAAVPVKSGARFASAATATAFGADQEKAYGDAMLVPLAVPKSFGLPSAPNTWSGTVLVMKRPGAARTREFRWLKDAMVPSSLVAATGTT